jgi:hypothetical protein
MPRASSQGFNQRPAGEQVEKRDCYLVFMFPPRRDQSGQQSYQHYE